MRSLLAPFLEVKLDAGQPGRFKGYGSTFGNVDLGKDKVIKGAFERSLSDHRKNGTLPAMYWMHDRAEPVGDWLDVTEDAKGLRVEGQLWTGDAETECSRKAGNLLRGTSPKGLSIGYNTKKYEFDQKTGIRSLLDVDLPEVSVVGYGMNPKALVTHIKGLVEDGELPTIRDLEEVLRDAGLSANQAKAILSTGYKALMRDAEIPSAADEIRALLRMRAALRGEEPGD
jgi:HK97 family phage prohead protease